MYGGLMTLHMEASRAINTPPAMNYVTPRLASREDLGLTMAGVLGGFQPPARVLSPVFLARMLRP